MDVKKFVNLVGVEDRSFGAAVADRLGRLAGVSIPDLTKLHDFWLAERKRNKKLDERSTQRRRDAEAWLVAIEERLALPSGARPVAKTPDHNRYIGSYIAAIKKNNVSKPTLDELEEISGFSRSTWSRLLRDPVFVGALKGEVARMQGYRYSKSDKSREFWRHVEIGIDELVFKLGVRIAKSHEEPLDESKISGGYQEVDDLDPEISDIMREDTSRTDEGKSHVDGQE